MTTNEPLESTPDHGDTTVGLNRLPRSSASGEGRQRPLNVQARWSRGRRTRAWDELWLRILSSRARHEGTDAEDQAA